MDSQTRYVAASVVTDRQTDTQNDYRNPTAHAPRVNDLIQDNIDIMYIIDEFYEGVCVTRRKAIVMRVAVVIVSYVTIGNIILCVESTDWR